MTQHEIDVLHTAMTDAAAWRDVAWPMHRLGNILMSKAMPNLPPEVQAEISAELRRIFQITDEHLKEADR